MRCCTPTRCILFPDPRLHLHAATHRTHFKTKQPQVYTHTHQKAQMTYGARCAAFPPPLLLLPLLIAMLLCGAGVCLSAAEEQKDGNWEPLRIHVSTEELEKCWKHCAVSVDDSTRRGGYGSYCQPNGIPTEDQKSAILKKILPAAVKLHTDRLLVQRTSGPLKVPVFEENNPCAQLTVPAEHHDPGVNDTDMVLYVVMLQHFPSSRHCAVGEDKRPIVSLINLYTTDDMIPLLSVRHAAHEIAHALGFDYDLMRDKGMLLNTTVSKEAVTVVKSPRVLEKAKEHYNCSTLPGIQIWRGNSNIRSHWGYDVARDELMSMTYKNAGLYTALTMAAFEDMGFFRAQWGMEEPMQWGRNAGCDFPPTNCESETVKKYPEMFCNRTDAPPRCTSNRLFVGFCGTFSNPFERDQCVFVSPLAMCAMDYADADRDHQRTASGSLRGRGSWCLDAEELTAPKDGGGTEVVAGVCAKVKCAGGKVQVQYNGSSTWHECPEGGAITPTSSIFTGGRIKCPKYDEVCTIADDGSSLVSQPAKRVGGSDGVVGVTSNAVGGGASGVADIVRDTEDGKPEGAEGITSVPPSAHTSTPPAAVPPGESGTDSSGDSFFAVQLTVSPVSDRSTAVESASAVGVRVWNVGGFLVSDMKVSCVSALYSVPFAVLAALAVFLL